MKINAGILTIVVLLFVHKVKGQGYYDYRQDSLQFKMLTRIYMSDQLKVDSLTVRKIYCDWCSEHQMDVLHQEAIRQSLIERYNPKYRKPGEHRLALIVRFSKEDFKKLKEKDE